MADQMEIWQMEDHTMMTNVNCRFFVFGSEDMLYCSLGEGYKVNKSEKKIYFHLEDLQCRIIR